jgi:hypothetical protein
MNRYLLLILLIGVSAVLGGVCFVVDGSGSMQGFVNRGSLLALVDDISQSLEAGEGQAQYKIFSSVTSQEVRVESVRREDINNRASFNGKYTLLGKMAEQLFNEQASGNYIIITDNVEDDPYTIGESAKFYSKLNENQVISSIDVSPRILNFSGNPYRGNASHYNGSTGLIVYFVSTNLDDAARSERNSLLRKLRDKNYVLFHIRPITAEHISLKSPQNTGGGFEIYSKGRRYHLRVQSNRSGIPSLQIDKANTIRFSIMMRSNYEYIGVRENTAVKVEHFRIKSDGRYLRIKRPIIEISPSRLPKSLEEGGAQLFDVKIVLRPMQASFMDKLKAMFNPHNCSVEFDLVLETGHNSLYMTEAVAGEFFTRNPSVYQKIYSSEDIISYFNPQDNKLKLSISNENNPRDSRTKVAIVYDNLPLYIGLVFVVVLILLGIVLIVQISSSPKELKLTIKYKATGKVEEHNLTRMSSVRIDPAEIKRTINRVRVKLLDPDNYYFKDSIFKSMDLPVKSSLEIVDKPHLNTIMISLDK